MSALVRRTARSPRYADFETVQPLVLNRRRALSDNMQAFTLHYTKQQLWGFRPEARLPEGWSATLARAERGDLERFLDSRCDRPAGFVTAAGPTEAPALKHALATGLGDWLRPFAPSRAALPAAGPRRLVILDRPGAADNQIFVLSPAAVSLNSRQAVALEVFLAGMGGDVGARLGRTLRIERGLTYHASSGLRRTEWPSWYVYSFGGPEQTPALVSGIFELFGAARGGLEPDELAATRDRLAKAQAFALETPIEQMAEVASAIGQGLPPEYPFERLAELDRLTASDVAAEARRVADLSEATIVVMGDAAKLRQALTKAVPAGTHVSVKTLAELEQGLPE